MAFLDYATNTRNWINSQPVQQSPSNNFVNYATNTQRWISPNTLGASSTYQAPTNNNTDSGGGNGGNGGGGNSGGDGGNGGGGGPSAEQIAMDQLNSGYSDYYRMLDEQMAGLGDQKTSQEQVANNTYNQGLNTVTSQFDQGQSTLEGNRKKTLNDLSENLMSSFRQGNLLLGARGASDSSAANQYSYALAKQGNKSRGEVQSQYDQNLFQLKNTYNTETKNL